MQYHTHRTYDFYDKQGTGLRAWPTPVNTIKDPVTVQCKLECHKPLEKYSTTELQTSNDLKQNLLSEQPTRT